MTEFAHDKIVPYTESTRSKKEQVAGMFDDIAPKYDFLNRFLSAGIDISWRRKALSQLKAIQPQQLLDVATGTGDVAIMAARMLHPAKIVGIDISEGMLELGRKKLLNLNLSQQIELQQGDSEAINFPDASFDAVTVAFGVRNFENLEQGLAEMLRVLRPGGKAVILEFSKPKIKGIQQLYNLYMGLVAPKMGGLFSKNKNAYQYLTDSVQHFPEGKHFTDVMNKIGYKETTCKKLSFGICSVYCGIK
ncbi:bifunctional demethylmenaquinone methyltransferase/2-methoxy-6-polyprenyl-1,4-benzoquinol methylase UbiE [Pollutibacter soli]|uniref:bifunctional demethylmenaquinone methyltransferase/2-methoxy-6-polyprenyl-1,4-benzoquinol methylase UbiE n=1 Tax=Pollutibacter soli TaxID=3034157 RepID=UPI0030139688